MRKRGRPRKLDKQPPPQPQGPKRGPGRPRKVPLDEQGGKGSKRKRGEEDEQFHEKIQTTVVVIDDGMSEGLHVTTGQVASLGALVACRECGETVKLGVRPTTKGMISEFTVTCTVCEAVKSTNTPNLIRERKRKRERKDLLLQKTENINYAHVAAFLDNGLGYCGLRHYCRYFNARCLNEATFIVYARQVINDVVTDNEESLLYAANIVREVFKSQLETDGLVDLTVAFTTTYHQWGSDFCIVAGAIIEINTGLVLDYDVANMYCHVCKINAKKIVSMTPAEMTEWFTKHQATCEIREWCDELDHDSEEGVREIEPKYLECFIAKKIWSRSVEKYGFRYTSLAHESDEKIHEELCRAAVYGDVPILLEEASPYNTDRTLNMARNAFQAKLKAKCPRERVQTKDRIMYVYAMSIPEYNRYAVFSNIKLREIVKTMESVSEEMEAMESNNEEEAGEAEDPLDIDEAPKEDNGEDQGVQEEEMQDEGEVNGVEEGKTPQSTEGKRKMRTAKKKKVQNSEESKKLLNKKKEKLQNVEVKKGLTTEKEGQSGEDKGNMQNADSEKKQTVEENGQMQKVERKEKEKNTEKAKIQSSEEKEQKQNAEEREMIQSAEEIKNKVQLVDRSDMKQKALVLKVRSTDKEEIPITGQENVQNAEVELQGEGINRNKQQLQQDTQHSKNDKQMRKEAHQETDNINSTVVCDKLESL